MRYFYAWTPFVIVGTVVLLSLPWLGLIALMVSALVALVALAALASAIVAVPYVLVRWYRSPLAGAAWSSINLVRPLSLAERERA